MAELSLLHIIAYLNRYNLVKIVLDGRRQLYRHINRRSQDGGFSPLHVAAQRGHRGVMHMFFQSTSRVLKKPCVVNFCLETDKGLTALHLAALFNHKKSMRLILKHHKPSAPCACRSPSLVHFAAMGGSDDCLDLALDFVGADAIRTTHYDGGLTPMHVAVLSGHPNIVKKLLSKQNKDDIDVKTAFGETALHIAAARGDSAIVDLLISNNADVSACNDSGMTPLHLACLPLYLHRQSPSPATFPQSHRDCMKQLCYAGADIDVEDKWGVSPMDLASGRTGLAQIRLITSTVNSEPPARAAVSVDASNYILKCELESRESYAFVLSRNVPKHIAESPVTPDASFDFGMRKSIESIKISSFPEE
jgi:ankyrin repeat protein